MKKLLNDTKLQKEILFVFLLIQPFLDCYLLYSDEVIKMFHFSPTTIIRLFFVVILGMIVFFGDKDKKNKKVIIVYGLLFLIYTVCHHFYTSNLVIHNYKTFYYTFSTEMMYFLRMLLPIGLLYLGYKIKFTKKDFIETINFVALILASIIIVSNILKISSPSYGTGFIEGNFFDWFINKGKYDSSALASRGWFNSANQISGLMMLLLPIVVYSVFDKKNKFNITTMISLIISMIMLGTRIASFGWALVLLMLLIIDFFLVLMKKRKFEKSNYIFTLIIMVVGIFVSFNFAPIVSYEMADTYIEADDKANDNIMALAKLVKKIKSGKLTEEEIQEIISSSICFKENGDLKTACLVELLGIDPIYYHRIYPVDEHREFWDYFMFEVPQEKKYGQRNLELLVTKDVAKEQKDFLTPVLGFGYSRFINAYLYLEHDYYVHYYTIGIIGILLLLFPYIIIALLGFWQNIVKKKLDFLELVLSSTLLEIVAISIVSGHIMDELIVSLYIGFVSGYLLKKIRKKESD